MEKIKGLWSKLLHQEATPDQVALGFALGFFVSFLPIPGFQILTAVALAYLLRTNKVACLIGLNLHLIFAPAIPLIFVLEYKVGKYLLDLGKLPDLDPETFNWKIALHEGIYAVIVGSLVIGIPCAVVSYFIVRRATIRWQAARRQTSLVQTPKP